MTDRTGFENQKDFVASDAIKGAAVMALKIHIGMLRAYARQHGEEPPQRIIERIEADIERLQKEEGLTIRDIQTMHTELADMLQIEADQARALGESLLGDQGKPN